MVVLHHKSKDFISDNLVKGSEISWEARGIVEKMYDSKTLKLIF
jgi:hypothetical protein